jgi:integrase
MFWTAARLADAARLGPGMLDRAGWLVFRQGKTGGEVAVPLARALPGFAAGMQADLDHLRAALDARPDRHMTFLTTEAGAARSVKAMGMWFAGAARAAGITGKSAHGLRKSRATLLAEAGATEHQIGAWTGHESLSEVRRYTRKADKRRILSGPREDQDGNETGNHIGNWKLTT